LILSQLLIWQIAHPDNIDKGDSLKMVLSETNDKEKKADILISVSEFYRNNYVDESLDYA